LSWLEEFAVVALKKMMKTMMLGDVSPAGTLETEACDAM
jgi:hypothetical protein